MSGIEIEKGVMGKEKEEGRNGREGKRWNAPWCWGGDSAMAVGV